MRFLDLISLIVVILSSIPARSQQPPPPPSSPKIHGVFLDCGANTPSTSDGSGLPWQPDDSFVTTGVPKTLSIPDLLPTLSTLRSFPLHLSVGAEARKFCYTVPIFHGGRYLVRATYFYGGVNGPGTAPPVFDQIVDGTFWTTVNTTADYAKNMSSYYEGVFPAGKSVMHFCIGANALTDSDPFISTLEFVLLDDSVYNSTDFTKNAMGLVVRSNFGSSALVRYPEDQFDRYWQPFSLLTLDTLSNNTVSSSGFWNLPPSSVFFTALVSDPNEDLGLQWLPMALPNYSYYIVLYFAETQPSSSRDLSVYINDYSFYSDLEVTSSGIMVFTSQWNISGPIRITLVHGSSSGPPLINAGEIFRLFPVGRQTVTRDVKALESVKERILNPPDNWEGDPCLPLGYSWTGVTCDEGQLVRVVALNLSNMELSGTLSPSIGNLTALTTILFENNDLRGRIPNLSRLKLLEILHLQDNQFTGDIPSSLSSLPNLRQVFLQNNNLTGSVPENLQKKLGSNLKILPGNHFVPSPKT